MADSHWRVTILFLLADKPEIEQEETFIHTGEGDQTEVICIVHASPRAEVTWYKDGMPLDGNSGSYLINHRGNRHTLTIPGVDSSKFGKYSCKAQNQYGEDQKTTEVSGTKTIELTNALQLRALTGNWYQDDTTPLFSFSAIYLLILVKLFVSRSGNAFGFLPQPRL